MGGDKAPQMIIGGVNRAAHTHQNVKFLIFGDEAKLGPLLEEFPSIQARCEIRHTADAVSNDDKPTTALRTAKNSSMRLAIDAVANGEASAIVSAGNTGALMAMATIVLKTLPGISRPAIATSFPTQNGDCVMLDLGANIECDADNLVQFAVMGEVYARNELKLEQPSIGILNVGVEGLKGNDSVKEAAGILQKSSLPIKFFGFVEGDDIGKGTVDVIVTDGFTGNIALKATEGTARLVKEFLGDAFRSSISSRLGFVFARRGLRKMRDRIDPRRYNGAMFLGLTGIAVKSHGGTDAFGFANAIGVAVDMAANGFNEKITEGLRGLGGMELEAREAAAS